MLSSFQLYGEFVYTLQQRFPSIQTSTLVLKPRGAYTAALIGNLEFADELVLEVIEEIDFERQRIRITNTSRASRGLEFYGTEFAVFDIGD